MIYKKNSPVSTENLDGSLTEVLVWRMKQFIANPSATRPVSLAIIEPLDFCTNSATLITVVLQLITPESHCTMCK